jgi:hypothetical protein
LSRHYHYDVLSSITYGEIFMKRTAKAAVALLLTAGIAMGGVGFGPLGDGATPFGGATGCCRATV